MIKKVWPGPGASKASELRLFLREAKCYPGDKIHGVVQLVLPAATTITVLQVLVSGSEDAGISYLFGHPSYSESQETLYFKQYVILLGQSPNPLKALRREHWVRDATDAAGRESQAEEQQKDTKDSYSPNTSTGRNVTTLLAGTYTFPFALQLPDILPPTLTISPGKNGFMTLEYFAQAELICKKAPPLKAKVRFVVCPLPVQLQRWLQLHFSSNEIQNNKPEAKQEEEAETETTSHSAAESVAMLSLSSTNAANHKKMNSTNTRSLHRYINHRLTLENAVRTDIETEARETRSKPQDRVLAPTTEHDIGAYSSTNCNGPSNNAKSTAVRKNHLGGAAGPQEDELNSSFSPIGAEDTTTMPERKGNMSASSKTKGLPPSKVNMSPAVKDGPWRFDFALSLRGGLIVKSKLELVLSMSRIVLIRGKDSLFIDSIIDNTCGSCAVSKIRYSLITHQKVRSRFEDFSFKNTLSDITISEHIPKACVLQLPRVDLSVPSTTPLTYFTDGSSTMTTLNVRIYCSSLLKTFSQTVKVEVLVVNAVDKMNSSQRLRRWTNYFPGRGLDKQYCSVPPLNLSKLLLNSIEVIDPSKFFNEECKTRLQQGSTHQSSVTQSESFSQKSNALEQKVHSSAMSLSKIHAALNFTHPTYIPFKQDPRFIDPLAGINPLTMAPVSLPQDVLTFSESSPHTSRTSSNDT